MRLKRFLKTFSKSKQVVGKYSYSLLKYKSADNSVTEILWNGTNLNPPGYILSKSRKFKLYIDENFSKEYSNYTPKKGERYFTYKSAEEFIKEKQPVLQLYWDKNYLDCKNTYSSYEEFFAIGCKSMNKLRIRLSVK